MIQQLTVGSQGLTYSDLVNTEFDGAAWYRHLYFIAHLVVEQSLCDRSLDGDLALAEVGLALADDSIGHLGLVGQVGHLYLRQDLYGIRAQTGCVDDLCLGDGQLQLIDLILQMGLCLFGGIIFGVLAEVALLTCLGDSG